MSAFQAERQEFESPISLPHYGINNMSLISQRDREVAIKALEMYAAEAGTTEYYLGTPTHSVAEINALLNWIKLEHYKHES